jgi:hypothetical protein
MEFVEQRRFSGEERKTGRVQTEDVTVAIAGRHTVLGWFRRVLAAFIAPDSFLRPLPEKLWSLSSGTVLT